MKHIETYYAPYHSLLYSYPGSTVPRTVGNCEPISLSLSSPSVLVVYATPSPLFPNPHHAPWINNKLAVRPRSPAGGTQRATVKCHHQLGHHPASKYPTAHSTAGFRLSPTLAAPDRFSAAAPRPPTESRRPQTPTASPDVGASGGKKGGDAGLTLRTPPTPAAGRLKT